MDVGRRRAGVKTGVVVGSVWESRMRSDEVRGGIKVFGGDEKKAAAEEPTEGGGGGNAGRAKRAGPVGGKRKTWKPESGGEGPAVQMPSGRGRGRGELSKSGDEMVKELSVSAVAKRGKRDAVSGADQGIPRSPVQMRRSRSEAVRGSVEKSSVELTKVKSGSAKILDPLRRDGNDGYAVRLSTENSEPTSVLDGSCQDEEEEEEDEEEEEEEEEEEAEEKEAIDESAVQIPSARGRGELSKSGDEMVKEPSVSADGSIKKSPAVAKRGKRDAVSGADQASPRSPVQARRWRSEAVRGSVEKSSVELRKVKSDIAKIVDQTRRDGDDGKSEENAVQLSTENSEPTSVLDGSCQDEEEEEEEEEEEAEEKEAIDGSADGYEEDPVGESKSDEIRKQVISSNGSQVKSDPKGAPREDDNISNDNAANDLVEEEEEEEEFSEELEEEEGEGEFDEGTDTEPETKCLEIKEIVVTEQKTSYVAGKEETKPIQVAEKPKSISPIVKKQPPPVVKPARVHRNIANPTPTKIFTSSSSSNVHKQPPPVTKRSSLHQNFATKTNSSSDKYQTFPERQNKLQNLVDLVMWRDVSKSTLIFGLGTFVVISSSYTKDISFSFITVASYLGLFYLAAIFLYRSIICRGYVDIDGSSCVLGEEEAIWLLKLVLPYLNEFLLKLRALFSGDPGTTMKLAVLLFVLARCGSSITIWKMAKFGFFGVFTVPKVCSSYSSHITAYGKFWIRRFRDAWNSCSHKKAVAVGIFTLVWNLCSVVARIWAVFMLYVAFRYYQQNLVREDWAADGECADDKCRGQIGVRKNSCGPTIIESSKGKKAS